MRSFFFIEESFFDEPRRWEYVEPMFFVEKYLYAEDVECNKGDCHNEFTGT